jgi:hypothetical protein
MHGAKDLSTGTFKDVSSPLKGDIIFAEKHRMVFTSISELRQIETLLNTFELKLHNFRQVLLIL